MTPAVASTMPLATAAQPEPAPTFVDSEDSAATAAIAFPSPPPSMVKRKSRRGITAVGVAAVLILLLAIGTVGYFGYIATHQVPTFSLSPATIVAGDTVLVTAKHLPANQTGEIRLHSDLVKFPFRADRSGAVSGEILIPFDSGAGDHLVELCWAARCHVSAILHVLDSGTDTSPTPGESPSPTPGATPSTGSSPSPRAGSSPTPRATPIPAASPTPNATPAPAIGISNYNIKIVTGSETVSGIHFSPGTTVIINFIQGATTNQQVGKPTVNSSGGFSTTFTVPSTATLGQATIRVCGTTGCLYATVNVNATG